MPTQIKSPIYLINKRFKSLRNSEQRVAEFVQKNMDQVVLLSLNGLAKKCDTSDATVLRFCRALGYLGFADFKISLVPELLRTGEKVYLDVHDEKGSDKVKKTFRKNFILQMDSTLKNCDQKFLKSLAFKISKSNRVLIIGLGGSAGVAHIFCDSLSSLGIYGGFFRDRSIIQNVVTMVNENDVLFGISHSGETEEVVAALRTAKEFGATTVGITNFSPSSIADIAEFPLITSVPDNLMGSYSCQARISQLMILELILIEISKLLKQNNTNGKS